MLAIRKQLEETKNLGLPINQNLYEHLTEVASRVILDHEKDGFEKFEEISALVKCHSFRLGQTQSDSAVNERAGVITG